MCKKFAFVTVVYNNYEDTLVFCRSLRQLTIDNNGFICFIVDNSDCINTQKKINSLELEFAFVRVMRPERNLGYFGGFNYFFDSNFFDSSFIVVLCNNDLVFDPSFCQKIDVSNYSSDIYVVCPDVVTMDGFHQNPHHLKPLTAYQKFKFDVYFTHFLLAAMFSYVKGFSRFWLQKKGNITAELKPCEINQGVGACYVLLPNFFVRIDRLFFPWFLYGEEACLSWQVRSNGGRLWFDPELVVWHVESATLSKLPKRKTYEYARHSYWGLRKLI